MKLTTLLLCAALSAASSLTPTRAANWPHWRGPNFDGSSSEKDLPDNFSKTENVKWTAGLPGPSAATPIIWGDTVFVSSTDLKTKTLRAIALDRKTGKELWNQECGVGFNKDDRSNYASPSPTTDGKLVFFYYGNGDLAAFDFAGKKIWSRNIQKDFGSFAFQWTYSTSPTLFDGKLFIQVLQRDVPVRGGGRTDGPNDSYLLALDPQTGKEIWKHIRPSDAVAESRESFTTPIPYTHAGRTELLVSGGDCISGHDLKTGAELWRWGTWNPQKISHWRLVPSPAAGAGVALAPAPKGAPIYAVKLGLNGKLADSDLAWISSDTNREVSTDVCTPLFYQGKFWIVNGERQTKAVACVDPATGKPEWVGELSSRTKIECSPTGADGKIYFMNFKGEVFVVEAGKEFKLLRTVPMGDDADNDLRSGIAASQGNLFIRTGSKLYCVGK